MEILYLTYYFPNRYILNEIKGLERRGHSVAVFSMLDCEAEETPREVEEIAAPIHVYRDAARSNPSSFLHPRAVQLERTMLRSYPVLTSPKSHARCVFHASKCIEFVERLGREIDLVHVHVPSQKTAAAPLIATHFGVPWTITVHSLSEFHRTHRHWSVAMLQNCDRIAAISDVVRKEIRQLGVDTPIDTVRMGVDVETFSPKSSEAPGKIVTVSRLSETKGLDIAIEAIAGLHDVDERIHYAIIGSGTLEEQVIEDIREHELASTVELLGFLTGDALLRHLDEAAIFLLPCVIAEAGNRDGIPVSLMEAMAMETPCVSTAVGGIPELISDGRDGIVVGSGDVTATRDAIARLLEDDDLRRAMGKRARSTILGEFTTEDQVDGLVDLFHSAVAQSTEPGRPTT